MDDHSRRDVRPNLGARPRGGTLYEASLGLVAETDDDELSIVLEDVCDENAHDVFEIGPRGK